MKHTVSTLQLVMGFHLIRGSSRVLVLKQIASSQRCLHSRTVGKGILIDGEVGRVMGRLWSASLVVQAHEVVVRDRDRFGVEGKILGAHQWLPIPNVLGANHLAGHLHEEIMELGAVVCWWKERAVLCEEVHGSTASLHRCL
uniref:ILL11 n=1 Tax=Arundo donax TaxID=35708 RepID=A0A0A9D5S4_ARUDO